MTRVAVVGDVHLNDSTPRSRNDADYLGTLLDKLGHIYDENDVVIFIGDLFEKPTLSYVALRRIMAFFLLRGKASYAIMGNHDLPNLNAHSLPRTALGLLETLNLIRILPESGGPLTLGPLEFHVVPFGAMAMMPPEKPGGRVNILLGHCFYENGLDLEYSLKRADLQDCGYDYVFLGHDHSPYEPSRVGNTQLVRLGSVCRNTSEAHHLRRTPSYFRFELDQGVSGVSIQPIPCLPAPEVFSPEVFEARETGALDTVSIGSLLERFHKWSDSHIGARLTVLGVLKSMGAPDDLVQYIHDKYQALGMTLK